MATFDTVLSWFGLQRAVARAAEPPTPSAPQLAALPAREPEPTPPPPGAEASAVDTRDLVRREKRLTRRLFEANEEIKQLGERARAAETERNRLTTELRAKDEQVRVLERSRKSDGAKTQLRDGKGDANAASSSDSHRAALERRAKESERRGRDNEARAKEAERRAADWQRRAASAEARVTETERSLSETKQKLEALTTSHAKAGGEAAPDVEILRRHSGGLCEVSFSPGEECLRAIQSRLASAKRKIDICVFTITDDRIAIGILDAHRRGVAVRVVTDNDKALDEGSDVRRLERGGVEVREDRTEYHMHHKFAVFDERVVLTGSYNWTRGAARNNEENLVVSDDPRMVGPFREEFESLWERLGPDSVRKR